MIPRSDELGNLLLFPLTGEGREVRSDAGWSLVGGPEWQHPACPPFTAVDFETYWTKRYSLTEMTSWEYVTHTGFHAYLVSLEHYDGRWWWRWTGEPSRAPWTSVVKHPFCSHNASFDELVYRRLQFDRVIGAPLPPEWFCTADLAAYLQRDRALELCAPALIQLKVDKSVRQDISRGSASEEQLRTYAGGDAQASAWIWVRWHTTWPELERRVSRLQRIANWEGVWVDRSELLQTQAHLERIKSSAQLEIPWANRYSVTGRKGVRMECIRLGIPPPPSLSLDEPAVAAWVERFHRQAPWMEAIRRYTKAHQIGQFVQLLLQRQRRDGTVPFELVYRKAPHTARWQTTGGLRMQNLDREDFEGISVRKLLHARPRNHLVVVDLSQIEPRVLHWLVKDTPFLSSCRERDEKGNLRSPYEAHARATMGWTGGRLKKENPAIYQLAKVRLLALGYQAWADKFIVMAFTMGQLTIFLDERSYSPDLNDPNRGDRPATFFRASQIRDRIERNDLQGWAVLPAAVDAVREYRRSNPLIVRYWASEEETFRRHVGGDYFMPLENGDVIRYFDVSTRKTHVSYPDGSVVPRDELWAWTVQHSRNPKNYRSLHGGKIVENRVQRLSREVLAEKMVMVAEEIDCTRHRWTVHDELIVETTESRAEEVLALCLDIMRRPPRWAPDLPLDAEGDHFPAYAK